MTSLHIEKVATSSEPWFIGRVAGVAVFGRSRVECYDRYIAWLREKRRQCEDFSRAQEMGLDLITEKAWRNRAAR